MLARISWLFSSARNCAPMARGPASGAVICGYHCARVPLTAAEEAAAMPATDCVTEASYCVRVKTGLAERPSQYPIKGLMEPGGTPPPPGCGATMVCEMVV